VRRFNAAFFGVGLHQKKKAVMNPRTPKALWDVPSQLVAFVTKERIMAGRHLREEDIVKAIRWRLGIPVDGDARGAQEIWNSLMGSPEKDAILRGVSRFLSEPLEHAIKVQLGMHVPTAADGEERLALESLLDAFRNWLKADEIRRSPRVQRMIRRALPMKHEVQIPGAHVALGRGPAKPPVKPQPPPAAKTPPPAASAAKAAAETQRDPPAVTAVDPATPADVLPADNGAAAPGDDAMNKPGQSTDRQPASSGWKYLPPPANEPDPHEESAARLATSPDGWPLLGARVRGKKHKHEGTHCDDWFEFATCGPWTLIAVSDGAGSKKFSRVGARASCQAAVELLESNLKGRRLRERGNGALEAWWDKKEGYFVGEDLAVCQDAVHKAMEAAYAAVVREADARATSAAHQQVLGRKLDVNDLSSTLLVAVHTSLKVKGADYSFVLACQVGDGMTAAVLPGGQLNLLAVPDGGDYSGETDFLTSRNKLEHENLRKKTFTMFRPMSALMVMTDGVADDYFPHAPGMLRLYADLVLNRVIRLRGGDDPAATAPSTQEGLARAECESAVEVLTAGGAQFVGVRSAAVYAEKLGKSIKELAGWPALLRAGAHAETPPPANAAERLREWLDAYTVRGSFDDRTLVVLHQENV
jgi:hypothetical protein